MYAVLVHNRAVSYANVMAFLAGKSARVYHKSKPYLQGYTNVTATCRCSLTEMSQNAFV